MKIFTTLHNWIIDKSFAWQVFIFFLLSYVILLPLVPFMLNAEKNGGRDLSVLFSTDKNFFILFVIFLTPLIETFIFQWLIYEQLNAFVFFNKRKYLVILLSGIIFGLTHNFSIHYQLFAFVLGCYFCFTYYYFKTYSKKAFIAVFIIHSIRNLLVILAQFIFQN